MNSSSLLRGTLIILLLGAVGFLVYQYSDLTTGLKSSITYSPPGGYFTPSGMMPPGYAPPSGSTPPSSYTPPNYTPPTSDITADYEAMMNAYQNAATSPSVPTGPVCGNYQIESPESCDDGNALPGDGCSQSCQKEECGNTILDANGEECDDGNTKNNDGCSFPGCRVEKCGDYMVQANEECDDGNALPGDGCSQSCQKETPTVTETPTATSGASSPMNAEISREAPSREREDAPAPSAPKCGDGKKEGTETCDDGNTKDNDDCSASCFVEYCSDGTTQKQEQCDDGNFLPGDGCSPRCKTE